MKNLILPLSFFIAVSSSLYSQIPNNGFENWTDQGTYSIPDNWGNLNPVTDVAAVYTCSKGTPGNPGTAYLKLISRTVTGMGILPGVAVSGILNTSTFGAVSGFAYSGRPLSLDGAWQYMANGADEGFISIYLTKWNASLVRRDTIGRATTLLSGMVMSWRNFSIPLTYDSSVTPDSAMIILSSSGKIPVSGSFLYVDNLSFTGGASGLYDQTGLTGLQVFPNPASRNTLVVDLQNRLITPDYLEVRDLQGKVLIRRNRTDLQFPVTLDISGLKAGEYLLQVGSPAGTFDGRFIRN